MFRKLVTNISFSPALIGQMGFYARRLKKEEATRRLGLVFTALALVVQSFAVFSAPEPANAASGNDMIRGGVDSKREFIQHYDANTNSIKSFFTELGITRQEIQSTKPAKINSKSGVLSWGLQPQFSAAKGEKKYRLEKSNGTTAAFYSRPLRLWDHGNYTEKNGSTYNVYVGHSDKFGWFAIMKNCGNLMTKKHPKPPVKPKPAAVCSSLQTIKSGETARKLKARSDTQNGADIRSYSFTVKDRNDKVVYTKVVKSSAENVTTEAHSFAPGSYTASVSVKTSVGTKTNDNCQDRFTVPKPGVSIEKTVNDKETITAQLDETFTYDIVVKNTGSLTLQDVVLSDPAPKNVNFTSASEGTITDNNWQHVIPELAPGDSQSFSIEASLKSAASGSTTLIDNTACVDTPTIPGETDACDEASVRPPEKMIEVCNLQTGEIITIKESAFDASAHSKDIESCASAITSSKSAVNLTQSSVDATDVIAQASDRIAYTITMKNKGQQPANVTFVEHLGDVTEYASVTDTGGATYDKEAKTLTWPEVELGANQEATRTFTVQLASTIPSAARGISDKTSYDCVMLNTFGNSVQIDVECAAAKQVEQVVAELPQTGPTENMIFAGVLLTIVTYFYARSRQLKSEVRLIRRGVNTGTI